ncbi:MAG: hypothetical protein ACRCYV_00580 [Aeromonas sp.]
MAHIIVEKTAQKLIKVNLPRAKLARFVKNVTERAPLAAKTAVVIRGSASNNARSQT